MPHFASIVGNSALLYRAPRRDQDGIRITRGDGNVHASSLPYYRVSVFSRHGRRPNVRSALIEAVVNHEGKLLAPAAFGHRPDGTAVKNPLADDQWHLDEFYDALVQAMHFHSACEDGKSFWQIAV